MSRYKIIVRNSPGWRNFTAATLGVSAPSPNWQGAKFAAILDFAATHFTAIRIDVSDALYRHSFMADGVPAADAAARANAMGVLWLAQHQDIIDTCRPRFRIRVYAALGINTFMPLAGLCRSGASHGSRTLLFVVISAA